MKIKTHGKMRGKETLFFHMGPVIAGGLLIPKNTEYQISDKYIDTEGRLIILKLKIEQNHLVISNMCAPTRDHKKEQLDFITLFKERISIYENENIIIGGDFNSI